MHTKIKICGIKTVEEVDIINRYSVDYMGLIFAPSKRQVTKEKALMLRKLIMPSIKVVGVFVDESVDVINDLVETCNLQVVQLSGNETVDMCRSIKAKVWKSISVKDELSLDIIADYSPYVDGIMLDTYSDNAKGGTGKTFDWQLVKNLSSNYPIILAGGLNPNNIVEAIEMVNPMVVDLNSGLETNLIKDELKIKDAFERLKEAFDYE